MKRLPGGLDNLNVRTAGLKDGKYGLALVVFDKVCPIRGVFTTNKMKAAPLLVTKKKLKNGIQAIVINSGSANCATGEKGLQDAEAMCRIVSGELGISAKNVAVASTGIIGRFLDMGLIGKQIKQAAGSLNRSAGGSLNVAKAIMTTDTAPKELAMDFGGFKIAGIAKGAGMIHPNMATMLCFIVTDASLDGIDLKDAVDKSFNMISVDNDTSTNDTVLLVSTGNKKGTVNQALTIFCQEMAKMLVSDGEGVTKLVEIEVVNAKNEEDAKKAARTIATSNLLKTAVFGNNPNWGRVAAALGYSGADVDYEKLKIFYEIKGEKTKLYDGKTIDFDYKKLSDKLEGTDELRIIVDLGIGKGKALAWSGDMSYDYIKINAGYS
jgi:glutamate N-acetyltransferase/amino-acid N-acetyltransferase